MGLLNTAILISGKGTNMQALIDRCNEGKIAAKIAVVVANVTNAQGLKRAQTAGIPTTVIDHQKYPNRESFENEITDSLHAKNIEMVCLAGFMRLLTKNFVNQWYNRLINIHPSLLPAYKGLNTHQRALKDGVKFTGCTVHYVRPEMDTGPIIAQAVVPIFPDDNLETLSGRVLATEHRCYPLALQMIASGKVNILDDKVIIEGASFPRRELLNPSKGENKKNLVDKG